MAHQRFCRVCSGWHELDKWPHNCMPERRPRSELSAPRLNLDTMSPVKSMLDGKIYDSKAALRRTYKDAGVVEVGDDSSVTNPKPFKTPKPDKKEIKNSIDRAFSQAGLGA